MEDGCVCRCSADFGSALNFDRELPLRGPANGRPMSFRLYKEGQGAKARGVLATIFFGTGIFATVSTYDWMTGNEFGSMEYFALPFFNWPVDLRSVTSVSVFALFLAVGVWLYNHRRLSDFLIDVESELKSKVTWPTAGETAKNSVVVAIACGIFLVWITAADMLFARLKTWIFFSDVAGG